MEGGRRENDDGRWMDNVKTAAGTDKRTDRCGTYQTRFCFWTEESGGSGTSHADEWRHWGEGGPPRVTPFGEGGDTRMKLHFVGRIYKEHWTNDVGTRKRWEW